ncbi:hypothetical protein R83H12_00019 [Fibrobacteria bacterium R8-3-H12]
MAFTIFISMNKFFLFLAFALFALTACSDDKSAPSHSELCAKKPITKECLAGRWNLENVNDGHSGCKPNSKGGSLKLQANGEFSFYGGYDFYEIPVERDTKGTWELSGTGAMKIKCTIGCENENEIDATVEVNSSGSELRVSTKGYTSFLQCSVGSPSASLTEVYSWQGAN